MLKNKKIISKSLFTLRSLSLLAIAITVVGSSVAVKADQFQAQIDALNQENSQTQGVVNNLASQATSYQDAINKLQSQINSIQSALAANQAKQAELQTQIDAAKAKIVQQKAYLAEGIKVMYIDGQLSSIEQLASSDTLSDYIDKEEYRTSVQTKIDSIIKEIAVLQAQLQSQKSQLDTLVSEQQKQNDALSSAQSQQLSMLAYNEGQQAAYNEKIAGNNGKISELRRQQIAANSRFSGGAPGTGYACGGGYPGQWCDAPQDSLLDSWGMYNRECVSYAAFKVANDGKFMPGWGWNGNADAKSWDDLARRDGIPVDYSPRAGDIAVSNNGNWGHVMYVESVNGDGSINISQYNANYDGLYSTRSGVSTGSLVFIHF